MTTNLKLNSADLAEIFSTTTGNTDYTEYSTMNILDKYQGSNTTIKGTENVNYSINGVDAVTLFHPKYYDSTSSNSSTDISIPVWCNKIGFVLQANGGREGESFTNYWQKYNIPQGNTSYGRSYGRTYSRTSYDRGQFITHRDWRSFYRYNHASPCNSCDKHWYSRTQTSTQNSSQNQAQTSHYYVTYFRNNVEYKEYYGSGGGGGGCCAGVYTIDPNNRLDKFTFTTNDSLAYKQIYFTSNEYANAINGNDVTPNTLAYSAISPLMMNNSDADNTNTDTRGTGGSASVITNGNITSIYTSSGSEGSTTTGNSSTVSGGNSGIKNSSTIDQHFLPIFSDSYGTGNNGSTNSTISTSDNHIIRYWFIR